MELDNIKPYVLDNYGSCNRDHVAAMRINPAVTAEYAALGFEASVYDDWELAEAEIGE